MSETMRNKKRFYKCKNCLREFPEINDDNRCANCGSDKIELIRIVQTDNASEVEIKRDM